MEAPVELEDGPIRDAEGYMRVARRYIYVATRYIRVRNGITSPILITSMSRNRCGSAEIDQDCSEIVARLCCFPRKVPSVLRICLFWTPVLAFYGRADCESCGIQLDSLKWFFARRS